MTTPTTAPGTALPEHFQARILGHVQHRVGDGALEDIPVGQMVEVDTALASLVVSWESEGQPVTVTGQPCMLFTLMDIEAWQETERHHDRLRTSIETAFANSSACMLIVDPVDKMVRVANESFCSLIGYPHTALAGRSIDDGDIWPSGIESGLVHARCGQRLECRASQADIVIADRTYVLWTFQDVTNRRIDERNLAAAIDATISESRWLSHAILDNLTLRSEPSREAVTSGLSDLTAREREVLALICAGMDDKTMARTLNVSGNTIRNHVARVYSKIGVNRRVAAAAWGRARGFDTATNRTVLLPSTAETVSAPMKLLKA